MEDTNWKRRLTLRSKKEGTASMSNDSDMSGSVSASICGWNRPKRGGIIDVDDVGDVMWYP